MGSLSQRGPSAMVATGPINDSELDALLDEVQRPKAAITSGLSPLAPAPMTNPSLSIHSLPTYHQSVPLATPVPYQPSAASSFPTSSGVPVGANNRHGALDTNDLDSLLRDLR